jgi:cellulose biosynthesis protein BcsQ
MDLVCHADGMEIAQRVAELSKVLFDVIIVDTAGRMGPAVGGLLRSADVVLIVTDESELALTATDLLLSSIQSLVGGTEKIKFLIRASSDAPVNFKQIAAELDSIDELSESAWSLPAVPYDPKVSDWPGSGNTLYSVGNEELTRVFKDICAKLGLVGESRPRGVGDEEGDEEASGSAQRKGWFQRLFGS